MNIIIKRCANYEERYNALNLGQKYLDENPHTGKEGRASAVIYTVRHKSSKADLYYCVYRNKKSIVAVLDRRDYE